MKTIILTIVILFSFSNTNAQDISSIDPIDNIVKENQNTKADFYESLIALHNFDIKIQKTEKVAANNKVDFYNELLTKNGFISYSTLTDKFNKENKNIITNTTQITGL